jgi:hypothetical protein
MIRGENHAAKPANHICPPAEGADTADDSPLDEVRASLRGLQYGSVNIIVQDGLVIQIDRTEKRRLRTNRRGGDR